MNTWKPFDWTEFPTKIPGPDFASLSSSSFAGYGTFVPNTRSPKKFSFFPQKSSSGVTVIPLVGDRLTEKTAVAKASGQKRFCKLASSSKHRAFSTTVRLIRDNNSWDSGNFEISRIPGFNFPMFSGFPEWMMLCPLLSVNFNENSR